MDASQRDQTLVTLAGAGLISKETGIEKNTISNPDEKMRVQREFEDSIEMATKLSETATQESNGSVSSTTTTKITETNNNNSNTE